MADEVFITIGSKGTAIPKGLTKLEPPVVLGSNDLHWKRGKNFSPEKTREREIVRNAAGWVSEDKRGDPFEIWPLDEAIRRGLVQAYADARWRDEAGIVHTGTAYFPKGWVPANGQPQLLAVSSESWAKGHIEVAKHKDKGRNAGIVAQLIENGNRIEESEPSDTPSVVRKSWTREELLIALNIYHKLTFGQLHARNPVIIALAGKLDRSANSIALKLVNFASLDPVRKMEGRKGMSNASALDAEVWNEYHSQLEETAGASEEALRELFTAPPESELIVSPKDGIRIRVNPPLGPSEIVATVKQRRGQEYFRGIVLNNFGGCCGVTGVAIRDFLIASHIRPWATHSSLRYEVRNGLCLSRLHDVAFERGWIAFDEELRLRLSRRLKAELPHKALAENFAAYEGEPLRLPEDAILPDLALLAAHRTELFQE